MKRIILFLGTNILIMVLVSVVVTALGLNRYLDARGLNITALMGFCVVWGMAGSFISLAISRMVAKWMMKIQLVDGKSMDRGGDVYRAVEKFTKGAGLKMPQVGIYDSPEINAFATGPTKNRSLVAVSTGLLDSMNASEVEGVIAHEVTHIANGDMVTMALIQGVINAFSLFLSRIIAYGVSKLVNEKLEFIVRIIVTFVLDIAFTILGSIVVCYFSRIREYKADAGGAKLAGREKMVAALERLKTNLSIPVDDRSPSLASMKISGKKKRIALFSTHPDLDDRIDALKKMSI